MNIISKIKGCLALAVVAAGFAAWAATVPTDAQGFDTTAENVAPFYSTTFVPGDYCVVDLTTGKVTEMKDVASAATFNTDDYKTTKMAFRYVPAGKFKAVCGKSNNSYKNLVTNDVSLSAYWMAVFPVTEAQYNAVMGGETTSVKPKALISWNDFRGGDWAGWDGTYANVPAPGDGTFVKALNDKVAAAGCKDKFDLCTSFQWERAARAGTRTDYFFSNETAASVDTGEFELLKNYAWYKKNNTPSATKDVGEKLPNAWGLYDVYGNIYENCLDWSSTLDGVTPGIDYAGRATGGFRVYRSGCYIADAGKNSSVYWTQKNPADGADSNGFRLIRKPATSSDPSVVPAISAKSAKFTVDVREEIALAKGEVTVAGVNYSDTAWGAADAEDVKLGYTNETTGATDVLKTGLTGEDVAEVDLPKKDGGYKLTHSTGDLTSFVKFTVSGYPLGSEGNPWEIGANAAADVIAFSNGLGQVSFKPVRGTVTKAGLETITNAMGGADFPAKLIAADGSETNDLVMVLGASGTAYDTLADALAVNEASYTLFETKGIPYLDWDDVNKQMTNAMCVVFETYTDQTTLVAGKTYAVMGDITNTTRITVNGTAESPTRLILCDGAKLTAKAGVTVTVSGATTNALIICGQENGTGALEATGGENAAGIGGGNTGAGGIVTINGGIITAMGGRKAAGIGGGLRGAGGIVTINGGTVTATGSSGGVGIGGGMTVTDHGTVTFGEGKTFVVKAGATAAGAAYVTQTAYTNDHSAKYVTLQPGCALKIPEGVNYSYAVTNTTAAMSVPATQVGTTNVYAFATNDSYEVTYTPAYGYEWVTAPAANPLTGTITADTNLTALAVKVRTYIVSYDGNGAAGTMADDTFTMFEQTNLTANAYTAVGYAFAGWTTNGSDKVAYADRAAGVDFAQPGETLALKAKWNDTGVEVATFDALTNALVAATNQAATLPVTVNLTDDITVPQGGVVKVYASPAVTFAGTGKFDVSDIVPQFGEPVTVGEGLAKGDLDRFDADGVSKPVFEEGKVVLHARGETETFPWVLDGAKGVTAWVDLALTNLAAVVINNGMPMATNAIDLVALTNNLATYGYEPAKTPLNALLAVGKDGGAPEYVKPVNWIGEGGKYATLEAALAAGKTAVVPNFVTEEIPEEIVETGKGDDGKTYTAVVENKPAEDVEEPVKATYAEGLLDLATSEKKNVTLEVTPTNVEDVAQQTVTSLTNVLLTALKDQEGHPMRIMETNIVDLSVYYNEAKQTELNSLIAIHIPWTINAEYTYGVSRMHDGVAQAIPEAQPPVDLTSGTECFVVDPDRNEIVLYVKNFSDYLIAGTMPLVPRIGASIKWKLCYATGSLFAQLKLAVTNGQASAVENLKFVFEDRTDGSRLWGASSDRSKQGTVLTGWTGLPAGTWRYVNVDGDALTAVKGGNTGTFGVQSGIDTANGTVATADRKIELYKKNAVISPEEANKFLGWVVWEAYGEQHCAPVGENAPMVANVARMLRAPLSVASVNKAAAYGSAYLMDGSDPDCEIAAFTVGEGTIRGRIALKGADGKAVAPGGNVKATLYGATSLDGLFASCGTLVLAADGTFATPIPAGKAFFRVKLEVVDVIK